MSAEAHPKLALRPMLPADAPLVAEIFRASIEELTGEEYSPAQQAAWMSAADDEAEFASRLQAQLTLIATLGGSPVGFASLRDNTAIELLYVHPAAARQGVGTMLCDALEKIAGGRGAIALTTDASDTARDFFSGRGFVPQQRNTVLMGDEWLANTTMKKQISPQEAAQ
jgi:putative acetyltransferase